jgi:phage-related protein
VRCRSDAYRAIYAVAIADAVWVVHAFQKKSKAGIATAKARVALVRARIKRLRERLK